MHLAQFCAMKPEQGLSLGILIKNPGTGGRECFLVYPQRRIHVGRSEACEINLREDPHVKRTHCVVKADDRNVYLEGYGGSVNPVRLNGEVSLAVRRLEAGDVITVSETDLLFKGRGQVGRAPTPVPHDHALPISLHAITPTINPIAWP